MTCLPCDLWEAAEGDAQMAGGLNYLPISNRVATIYVKIYIN